VNYVILEKSRVRLHPRKTKTGVSMVREHERKLSEKDKQLILKVGGYEIVGVGRMSGERFYTLGGRYGEKIIKESEMPKFLERLHELAKEKEESRKEWKEIHNLYGKKEFGEPEEE
jgi:hypothetical protein